MPDTPIYRRRAPVGIRIAWCALCGCGVFFGLLIGVAAIVVLFQSSAKYVWAAPLAFALAGFAAKAGLRIPRSRVTITSDAVIIAGPLRTWRVALTEATSFVASGTGGQPTVWLKQRSGRPIAVWALNRNGFVWNERRIVATLEPAARELNAALEKARDGKRHDVPAVPSESDHMPPSHGGRGG